MNSKTQRIIVSELAAPVVAGFATTRTILLTVAAFSNINVGDWIYIIRSFSGTMGYDLIASVGQYAWAPSYFSINNFNDQGTLSIQGITGAVASNVSLPGDMVNPLDLVYTNLRSNIGVTGTIQPGTGITAASIQSLRIAFNMVIDLVPRTQWDSDYAFDLLRQGR